MTYPQPQPPASPSYAQPATDADPARMPKTLRIAIILIWVSAGLVFLQMMLKGTIGGGFTIDPAAMVGLLLGALISHGIAGALLHIFLATGTQWGRILTTVLLPLGALNQLGSMVASGTGNPLSALILLVAIVPIWLPESNDWVRAVKRRKASAAAPARTSGVVQAAPPWTGAPSGQAPQAPSTFTTPQAPSSFTNPQAPQAPSTHVAPPTPPEQPTPPAQ